MYHDSNHPSPGSAPQGRQQILIILGALSGLAWVLGLIGFGELRPAEGWLCAAYLALQLFTLESGAIGGELPLSLEVARWLAPLTLAGGLVGAVLGLFGRNLDRVRARFLRRHHIICGLGDKGLSLACDLLASGARVVALDPAPQPEHLTRLRSRGGIHLRLMTNAADELTAAGIRGAASFTALTPHDSRNLVMALAAEKSVPNSNDESGLRIFAHIGAPAFRDLLDRNGVLEGILSGWPVIRSFNAHANLARLLLRSFPLETAGHADGATNVERRIHLLLPALGPEASALLIHAARTGHYLGCRKIHIHVISPKAEAELKALQADYPELGRCCEAVEAIPLGADACFGTRAAAVVAANPHACHTIIPSFTDNPDCLREVLRIHERIGPDQPCRLLVPPGLRPVLKALGGKRPLLASRLAWLPDIADYCGCEAVFGDHLDTLALAIHHTWYQENERQIRAAEAAGDSARAARLAAKPTFKEWHALTEEQRDSSRSQADHIAIKIRAAGLDPATTGRQAWIARCDERPELVEQLAGIEHERWAVSLWLADWKHAPIRDDSRKLHPDLKGFDALDDATRQYDRDAVRNMPCETGLSSS